MERRLAPRGLGMELAGVPEGCPTTAYTGNRLMRVIRQFG